MRVIRELLKKGADVSVCLTCESIWDDDPVFRLPAETARKLAGAASELGVRSEILNIRKKDDKKAAAIRYLEENLFSVNPEPFSGETEEVEIYRAADAAEECALAASKAVSFLRRGYRMRDIAVVSPNWEKYRSMASGVFEKYGLSVNMSEKSDIVQKPVLAFVMSALDIILNDWDYVSVFRYLKTELAEVSPEERDELENYVLKWNIRGRSMWTRRQDWSMPPQGYSEELSEEDTEALSRINDIRRRVAAPLETLHDGLSKAASAADKVKAVYLFLEATDLYARIGERTRRLIEDGRLQPADEYAQLWSIRVIFYNSHVVLDGHIP